MWTQGPEWTYVLWDQRAHSFLFAFKPTNEKLPYIYIANFAAVMRYDIVDNHGFWYFSGSRAEKKELPLA